MAFGNRLINTGGAGGGGIAFVSSSDDLKSLDVSNPSNITLLDTVNTVSGSGGFGRGGLAIDRDNNVAYTVNSSNTLTSIDISDTSNLSILDTLVIGTSLTDVVIDPTTGVIYVSNITDVEAGIYSVDISNPSNMSVLQAYNGGSVYTYGLRSIDIDIINKRLVLCNSYYYRFAILNISNPSNITNVTQVARGQSPNYAKYNSDGTRIYNSQERTVEIMNASLGSIATYTSQDDIYYSDSNIEISENFTNFYLGGRVSGKLTSFDTTSATLTSSLAGFTDVFGLAIDHINNIIYVAERGGNIKAVQIVDKNTMTLLSTTALPAPDNLRRIVLL